MGQSSAGVGYQWEGWMGAVGSYAESKLAPAAYSTILPGP